MCVCVVRLRCGRYSFCFFYACLALPVCLSVCQSDVVIAVVVVVVVADDAECVVFAL